MGRFRRPSTGSGWSCGRASGGWLSDGARLSDCHGRASRASGADHRSHRFSLARPPNRRRVERWSRLERARVERECSGRAIARVASPVEGQPTGSEAPWITMSSIWQDGSARPVRSPGSARHRRSRRTSGERRVRPGGDSGSPRRSSAGELGSGNRRSATSRQAMALARRSRRGQRSARPCGARWRLPSVATSLPRLHGTPATLPHRRCFSDWRRQRAGPVASSSRPARPTRPCRSTLAFGIGLTGS